MSKGSGTTRSSSKGSPRGLAAPAGRYLSGSGNMQLSTADFPADLKMSELIDGGQSVNGGEYYIMNRSMDMLTFSLENGYNDDYGTTGTTITVSFRPYGTSRDTILTSSFVEGTPVRESGGRNVYNNEEAIRRRIDGSMPYYVELANRSLRGEYV